MQMWKMILKDRLLAQNCTKNIMIAHGLKPRVSKLYVNRTCELGLTCALPILPDNILEAHCHVGINPTKGSRVRNFFV